MKLAAMVVVVLAAACGDNSDQCGSGTTAVDHVCVPAATCGGGTTTDVDGTCVPDGTVVCGAGTTFDPMLGTCVVDSSVCQDGTVLINGMCVDPNKGLVVDVEEGPEPNGLGFLEASANPAGIVSALRPVGGSGLVIHGHIDPFQDADHDGLLDPDVDTYLVEVTAPTLVHITAAGSSSVTAGFYVVPNVTSGSLQNWQRVGMNLGGNTSKRQLYLPAAGEYVLAIADSRTLYQLATTQGPVAGAPGGPDGDYYITLDALDTPEPTLLAVTNSAASDASTIGPEETKFYTVPMGIGLNAVTVDMPAQAALSSVAVFKNAAYQETATESDDPFLGETPAGLLVGGYKTVDLSTIVVEPAYNIALAPVPYTLSVDVADATSMPIGGVTPVVVTELANQPSQIAADLAHYNQFYFDIHNNPDQTIGISITWTHPVRGQIFDENGDLAVAFVDTSDTADTWTTFSGLARLHDAGRYYFVVYDPAGVPGTSSLGALCMVRTLSPLVLEDISDTSDLAATFPPATSFENTEAVFSYDPGTAPWQTFDSTGDETRAARDAPVLYDAAQAYGRLDALILDGGAIVDPALNELLAHTCSIREPAARIGRIPCARRSRHGLSREGQRTRAGDKPDVLADVRTAHVHRSRHARRQPGHVRKPRTRRDEPACVFPLSQRHVEHADHHGSPAGARLARYPVPDRRRQRAGDRRTRRHHRVGRRHHDVPVVQRLDGVRRDGGDTSGGYGAVRLDRQPVR